MKTDKFAKELKKLYEGDDDANNEQIWRSFQTQDKVQNAYYFSHKIIEILIDSDKKDKVFQFEQQMLATLFITQFYKNHKPKSLEVLQSVQKFTNHRKNKIYGHDLLVLLLFLRGKQKMHFLEHLISRYVLAPYQIDWQSSISKQFSDVFQQSSQYTTKLESLQDLKYYNCFRKISFPDLGHKQSKLLSFSYPCFNDFIHENKYKIHKQTYMHVLDLLKGHIQALQGTTKTKIYLQCLILIIRKMITFYGCFFPAIISEIGTWLTKIIQYPDKLGRYAKQTFEMIHQELKFPGFCFRKQLRTDFPKLDLESSKTVSREFYFIGSTDQIFETQMNCSLMNLRKAIILQIVKGCRFEKIDSFITTVKKLDSEMTYQLYKKCLKAIDFLGKLDKFNEIHSEHKESMIEIFRVTNETLTKQKPKNPKKQGQQLERMIDNQNQLGIFSYPRYQIIQVDIYTFLSHDKQNSFAKIIQRNKTKELNYYKNKIPFIFSGSDQDFNTFINSMCKYISKTKLQEAASFRIYFIPRKGSSTPIINYLSSKDLWYRRSVYWPYKYRMIYPYVGLQYQTKDLFPTYIYSQLLFTFLREAKKTVNVQAYKCKLKIRQRLELLQIFFCSHVLLGTMADAQILRQQKEKQKFEKYSIKDYFDLLLNKLKKINSVNIDMLMLEVDSFKQKSLSVAENKVSIESLAIYNLPLEYCIGNEPNPTSINLQMSILLENYGKIFRKQLDNKDNFKKQNIKQAFKDLFICTTIQNITICINKPEAISLIIDGRIVSNVQKLVIEPAYSDEGLPITLPFQCFLPLQ